MARLGFWEFEKLGRIGNRGKRLHASYVMKLVKMRTSSRSNTNHQESLHTAFCIRNIFTQTLDQLLSGKIRLCHYEIWTLIIEKYQFDKLRKSMTVIGLLSSWTWAIYFYHQSQRIDIFGLIITEPIVRRLLTSNIMIFGIIITLV